MLRSDHHLAVALFPLAVQGPGHFRVGKNADVGGRPEGQHGAVVFLGVQGYDALVNLRQILRSPHQQNFQLVEMEREDTKSDAIREKLLSIDIDDMSPRDAWNMLNDLCEEEKKDEKR